MPFSTIVGHAPIVALLRKAIAARREPQSLLFAGPEGVGKRTMAIALAQAVNCPKRRDDDACGSCPTCKRIAAGQHSDVTILDKGEEPSIKIGPMRARVLEPIGYRPFEAARRVAIIDGADEMTEQAQDALLKTLEEPPPSAIIVLVTAYPDSLKTTIQSRCRRLRFGALSPAEVLQVLVERCRVEPRKARVLAAGSGGSVARALAADAGDLSADRELALALLVTASRGGGVAGRLQAAVAISGNPGRKRRDRDALGSRLSAAAALMRDLTVLQTLGPGALSDAELEADLRPLERAYNLDRLSSGFAAITSAQQALDRNASPKIVADWIALTL
jgi:DNA polymerase-3 subunit delta'